MSTLRKIKYQTIRLNVAAANNVVSTQNVTTDRNYKSVVGIHGSITDAIAAENGTFTKFEIDSREIYPTGFEAKIISPGRDVPPNERFDREVNERAENSTVNITYTDPGTGGIVYPYSVIITLKLENPLS